MFVRGAIQDKAIKALTAALAPKAKALRDGKVDSIDAKDLVPGDVVVVRLGDIVPADIKLLGEDGEHDQPLQVRSSRLAYRLKRGHYFDPPSLKITRKDMIDVLACLHPSFIMIIFPLPIIYLHLALVLDAGIGHV